MKILIKELCQNDSLTESIEICGKVTYVDIGNKNITIKGSDNISLISDHILFS